MGALAYAVQLLGVIPDLINAGASVVQLVTDGKAKLEAMQTEKRDPTPAEWDALNAQIKALRDELHAD